MLKLTGLETAYLSSRRGFTVLGIVLFLGVISVLAGIAYLTTSPTQQLGDSRNAQRRLDVLIILGAIYQFSLDNNGILPGLPVESDICNASGTDAFALKDGLITASSTYLVSIPFDPIAKDPSAGSEYFVVKKSNNHVAVCAPNAENDVLIEVEK